MQQVYYKIANFTNLSELYSYLQTGFVGCAFSCTGKIAAAIAWPRNDEYAFHSILNVLRLD